MRVQGLGLTGFRVEGLGSRVQGLGMVASITAPSQPIQSSSKAPLLIFLGGSTVVGFGSLEKALKPNPKP